jgi:hypothetical protein
VKHVLAIVSLVSAAAAAQDYQRTVVPSSGAVPICIAWNKREFVYSIDMLGSSKTPGTSEFVAIQASFAAWQVVSNGCSDWSFKEGPRITAAQVGKGTEANNVLVFREKACPVDDPCHLDDTCANRLNCWDHSDSTIALTTTTFLTSTGLILDADIELNAAPHTDGPGFLFTTISSPPCEPGKEAVTCVATDVQNTVTHEIGHALGFDHVSVPASTMEPYAPTGDVAKRLIDPGTQDGFCSTYPKGQPPSSCDPVAQSRKKIIARNTGTGELGCSQAPAMPLLAAVALWWSRRRRARSRAGFA